MGKKAMFYELSEKEIRIICEFAETGERSALTEDIVSKFVNLNAAFTKRLYKSVRAIAGTAARMEKRIERYKTENEKRLEEGVVSDTGFDSVEIARALLYKLQQLKCYRLNKAKVQTILFRMYGSWLAGKNERIFTERPVAGVYGPIFWKVHNKVEPKYPCTRQDFESVAQRNPGVANYIGNVAKAYYDLNEKQIAGDLMKIKPYLNATPEHNNGKWGKELDEKEIVEWINDLHRREEARREIVAKKTKK